MRVLLALACLGAVVACSASADASSPCASKEHEKCDATVYEDYVSCVRRRAKRSICDNSCDDDDSCGEGCKSCDCDACYNGCENDDCQESQCCNTCCSSARYQRCRTNHCCHKTCHAECQTSSCRKSCRRSCYESINNKRTEETKNYNTNNYNYNTYGGGSSNATYRGNNTAWNAHNITTVIHLNNVINNTQVIEVPINMNYTHQNNITLREASGAYFAGGGGGGGVYGPAVNNTGGGGGGQCCLVIGPKQCQPTKEYPGVKCFHTRSRQCGQLCSADIMHMERRQVCLGGAPQSDCREQVIYIPQPQPRCVYQSSWPYVACGIQQQANCEGCYGHYSDRGSTAYTQCSAQCYNDFGSAPYFRQGPVYQPSFSHAAPCSYGDCGYGGGYGGGYGAQGAGGYQYPAAGGFPPMGGYIPPPPEEEILVNGNDQLSSGGFFNNSGFPDPMVNVMIQPGVQYPPYFNAKRDVQIEAEVEYPDELRNASFISGSQEVFAD